MRYCCGVDFLENGVHWRLLSQSIKGFHTTFTTKSSCLGTCFVKKLRNYRKKSSDEA